MSRANAEGTRVSFLIENFENAQCLLGVRMMVGASMQLWPPGIPKVAKDFQTIINKGTEPVGRPITKASEDIIPEMESTHLLGIAFSSETSSPSYPAVSTIYNFPTTTTTTSQLSYSALPQRRLMRRREKVEKDADSYWAVSSGTACAFCRKNGETREFYTTHILKDIHGKVICPVLRAYTCPRCGETGDAAHTESHCPLTGGGGLSVIHSLHTRRTSCGMRLVKYH